MSALEVPLSLSATAERWPLIQSFRITGYVWDDVDVLLVTLKAGGVTGRGEAAGVYYRGETVATMLRQVESVRSQLEAGISRDALTVLLRPGGARNALDCAFWDLEAKLVGRPVWQLAGLPAPKPLLATFTCGADTPERMAKAAASYSNAKALKLKLTGDALDAERVRMVRSARSDVWLGVDANQGLDRVRLERLMPALEEAKVALIEQPFPVGADQFLEEFESPIPIAADESAQSVAQLDELAEHFDVINIKLDKCGGLTEGLKFAHQIRTRGLQPMVGNMLGTSLAMAPGYLLGQLCTVVDLDGPISLKEDRATPAQYRDGYIICPESLWGYPTA